MLDISQAANLLTSMGVSNALATRAAERTAQNHSGADPLTFLKELRATLEELSKETPAATAETAASTASSDKTVYTSTTDLYTKSASPTAATSTKKTTDKAAVTVPFKSLAEFKQWEKGLGNTFAADYKTPDYIRMHTMVLSGGNDTVVGRYMFFKNHPEFAADYEAIRSGKRSQFPTDGSTLVKSDLTTMPAETASFYKKNSAMLLAAEGFNMDPTLVKMRTDGTVATPEGLNPSEWLMSNKWTADGVVPQDNRLAMAQAPYIGLNGKGADTYRRTTYDAATNSIINFDGAIYDPVTGEVKA